MAFGVTSTGFVRPRLVDIQTEINNTLIALFGASIDTSAGSVFGQLSGIIAEREDLIWQAMEDTYNSQYPDTAFGTSLDNVAAISGIPRLGALPSTLQSLRLFGTAGTVVPAGTKFSVVGSPNSQFTTDGDVTLVAGQDTIQRITFSQVPTSGTWQLNFNGQLTGTLAFNISAASLQTAIRALDFGAGAVVTGDFTSGFTIDFAGVSGKQSWLAIVITSDTLVATSTPVVVSVTVTQAGINQGIVNVTCTSDGPTVANAGTLTVIVTPVTGLTSALNITDATVGRLTENDNQYRARRALTLQIAGAGTFEAIRSRLLELSGVTAAILFENVNDIPDTDGRPPHSFESIVQGGDQDAIANLLWAVKPAGIQTDGSILTTITDSQGQPHPVRFSRPTDLPVYVAVTITKNSNFPANGAAGAAQAIVDAGNALGIGKEVVVIPYLISSLASIPGIENVVLNIGLSPGPVTDANIPVAPNEIADFDLSRVTVITV
jgi:uncharacterized phage protein gp47/JayE